MSLLMDALKQAEHAKRDKPQTQDHPAEVPESSATVTHIPPLEETPVESGTLAAESDLSLSPVENATLESAPVETFDPDLEIDKPAERISEVTDTLDTPDLSVTAPAPISLLSEEVVEPVKETAAETATGIEKDISATNEVTDAADNIEYIQQPEATVEDINSSTLADATRLSPAAERVFAASMARQSAQRKRTFFTSIFLAILLALALGGYHYWASLNQNAPPPVPLALPLSGTTLPGDESNELTEKARQEQKPGIVESEKTASTTPNRAPLFEAEQRKKQTPAEAPKAAVEDNVYSTPPAQKKTGSRIRFKRSVTSNELHQGLEKAYQAYQAGNFSEARLNYGKILQAKPDNRDALMGLAAIAVRQQETDSAREYYREILRRYPGDNSAQLGLLSLQQQPDPKTESDLKGLLLQQPRSANLQFALANLYAAEQHWPLAQQAYFEAHRLAPENPDYAFNLAISLEHLDQVKLALQYYQRALQLHRIDNGALDTRIVQQRIDALSAQVGL